MAKITDMFGQVHEAELDRRRCLQRRNAAVKKKICQIS